MAPRLKEDIAALAAIERGSATPGERRSGEWVAARLRELCASDVRLEGFGYGHTQARSPVVPGANDNASGVAGVLELVRPIAAEPLDGTEVVVLVCGCEESGMGGMGAWRREARLDPERTLVLGLDTIGSGEPVVLEAEGGSWPVRYRSEDVARGVREGLRRWRIGGWTDPALAAIAGVPAVSILSVRDGGFPNYHLPSDVPEHVDLECVSTCVRASFGIAQAFSA